MEEVPNNSNIEITIERGGEYIKAFVPEGATVEALIQNGHLRGIQVANTRVNGAPAVNDTALQTGDTVSQVPKSGTQGH